MAERQVALVPGVGTNIFPDEFIANNLGVGERYVESDDTAPEDWSKATVDGVSGLKIANASTEWLMLTGDRTDGADGFKFSVNAGETYVFSCIFKITDASPADLTEGLALRVAVFDSDDAFLSEDTSSFTCAAVLTNGEWGRLTSNDITEVDPNQASMGIGVQRLTGGDNEEFTIGNISVRVSTTPQTTTLTNTFSS